MVTMAWAGNSYYYTITFNPTSKEFTSKAYNSISPYSHGYFKKAKIFSDTDIYMGGYLYNIVNEPASLRSFTYS